MHDETLLRDTVRCLCSMASFQSRPSKRRFVGRLVALAHPEVLAHVETLIEGILMEEARRLFKPRQ